TRPRAQRTRPHYAIGAPPLRYIRRGRSAPMRNLLSGDGGLPPLRLPWARPRAIKGLPSMLSDLSTTPIAETLRSLASERRSGDLQVRSGKLVKIVFFDQGRVVVAASNLKKDRLGEALMAIGRITDEEFNLASAIMKADRKRKFG